MTLPGDPPPQPGYLAIVGTTPVHIVENSLIQRHRNALSFPMKAWLAHKVPKNTRTENLAHFYGQIIRHYHNWGALTAGQSSSSITLPGMFSLKTGLFGNYLWGLGPHIP